MLAAFQIPARQPRRLTSDPGPEYKFDVLPPSDRPLSVCSGAGPAHQPKINIGKMEIYWAASARYGR